MTRVVSPRSGVALALLFSLCLPVLIHAASVTLFPSADATLIERNPSNSIGAATWITAGTTQNGNSNRALIQFDVAAALPAGATIVDVGLNLWVTRQPSDGYAESVFSLRRMLRSWGEGANPDPPTSPGFGLPALPGDATWLTAYYDTNSWTVPGGLEGVDYSAAISTTALIAGVRAQPYFFESGGAIADVQFWLDHPDLNFGWMLKTEDETSKFTARRFGSRELQDPEASPQLIVTYVPPTVITDVHTTGSRFSLTFQAEFAYSYRVESRDTVSGTNAWMTLTNFGLVVSPGPRTATDSLTNARRFYRVRRD